ncbi:YciI family protein [Bacillus sp. SCS-153A]|uniref:YciI family protein n=1 Tax=Rossellomorea sedimentorum TaxID=3115294 RepID=UPI003905B4C0
MERQQFLYKLRLIEKLTDEKNWTEKDNEIVARHFDYLQKMLNSNKLILAGKTKGIDANTFGIVIFESGTEEEALSLMKGDPAVQEGIMTAELFPYQVALMQEARQ